MTQETYRMIMSRGAREATEFALRTGKGEI
jgi:hypothetical protein